MQTDAINNIVIDDFNSEMDSYLHGTSLAKPLKCAGFKNNYLYINHDFYKKNKEIIQNMILGIINNSKEDSFTFLNAELLNEDVIADLLANKYIKNVNLEGDICLDRKTIDYILSNQIYHLNCNVNFNNDPELLYQYIPGLDIINYPEVAGCSVMDFGKERVELYIVKELDEKELEHLRILFTLYPQEKIYINFKEKTQLEEIIDVTSSNKVIIRRFFSYTKEEYIHLNEKYDNVYFSVANTYETSINNLIFREEIMENIINEVNNYNLSPLEKYMYLYNIVKMYKEYKETKYNIHPELSRYSEYTLFNDYMVCVGYATLLEELVERLNDKNVLCSTYGCRILDDGENNGHCRCLVRIKDEKYGIDGIYISDPTWDSVNYYKKKIRKNAKHKINYKIPTASKDLYNHFLLTKEESMDELISYSAKDVSDALFMFDDSSYQNNEYESISWDIDRVNEKLGTNILTNKINYNHKQNQVNSSPIHRDILIQAITNLYKIIYKDSNNIDNLVHKTIEENILKQNEYFIISKDKFGFKTKTKK